MQVLRLGEPHYDAIIGLMNAVFSEKNGREMNFEQELPKMCVRDEEHMRKHFGLFEDGALVSVLGVYPFDVRVGSERLRFATVGNIATHPAYQGRGYMTALLARAMQEVEELDIDACRLGGLRARYNRYGFEMCGRSYTCTLSHRVCEQRFAGRGEGVSFYPIERTDREAIAFAERLYNENAIAVPRTGEDTYRVMTTWRAQPYLAMRDGHPIGYLAVLPQKGLLAEQFATSTDHLIDMLAAYQREVGADITCSLQPHMTDAIRALYGVCEMTSVSAPSHFKIRHVERVIGAFLRLKASYTVLPAGELCLGIESYGTVRIFVQGEHVGCERTQRAPDLTLSPLAASRYVFGPYAPEYTADAGAFAKVLFPLPLGWNGQDRV